MGICEFESSYLNYMYVGPSNCANYKILELGGPLHRMGMPVEPPLFRGLRHSTDLRSFFVSMLNGGAKM
jgi:hypothetical protein